jgi:hypothetical protein
MYEDDGDWGVYQDLANEADEAEDQRLSDGQTGRRPLKGSAAAKRMPVNREEVVRVPTADPAVNQQMLSRPNLDINLPLNQPPILKLQFTVDDGPKPSSFSKN